MGILKYIHNVVMPLYKPSPLGAAIADSMANFPDDWQLRDHTVKHSPSGIEIWAGNNTQYREIYAAPNVDNFGKANKSLSFGDKILIDELISKLRSRAGVKPEDVSQKVIHLLSKTTN